jgi:hypothetical protein
MPMSLDAWIPSAQTGTVFFDRRELERILRVYGFFVSAGDWRDYAIEVAPGAVSFAIFRRTSEEPLYRIEKRPALARKQGSWAVIGSGGHVLKRAHDLDVLLRFFDRKRLSIV